jgi:Alpha/beta hydrolase domain
MTREHCFGRRAQCRNRQYLRAALSLVSLFVLLQSGCSEEEEKTAATNTWKDPGTVPNPEVVAVAANAGQTGKLFGKSKNLDTDYLEEEFFFTGTSPAYTSRMVVHRPADPAQFSGTVFMEWYNVTGGIDMGVMWALNREYFIREGHVHVGVSAQKIGADALKTYDAERYTAIKHPGDTAADAIFSQAAMAMRTQTKLLLGPGMQIRALLAGGQSQSSGRLAAYIDGVPPTQRFYDGYLLHSGGTPTGNPDVPVFLVFTMLEADGVLVDLANVVEWEVAAASHSDAYIARRGGEEQGADLGIMATECASPMNEYPAYMVYNAAIDWLNRWVRKGERPPSGDPLQPGQVDRHGNALGGVRLQDVEVPVATYTATGDVATNLLDLLSTLNVLSTFTCLASGGTVPLTEQQLLELYPTHEAYVEQYTEAADRALASGYLLQADYEAAIRRAQSAPIPN